VKPGVELPTIYAANVFGLYTTPVGIFPKQDFRLVVPSIFLPRLLSECKQDVWDMQKLLNAIVSKDLIAPGKFLEETVRVNLVSRFLSALVSNAPQKLVQVIPLLANTPLSDVMVSAYPDLELITAKIPKIIPDGTGEKAITPSEFGHYVQKHFSKILHRGFVVMKTAVASASPDVMTLVTDDCFVVHMGDCCKDYSTEGTAVIGFPDLIKEVNKFLNVFIPLKQQLESNEDKRQVHGVLRLISNTLTQEMQALIKETSHIEFFKELEKWKQKKDKKKMKRI